MRAFVNEYLPGSGAMASQLDADIVSVMLLPVGNVALAAPAQQSRRMRTSDFDRCSSVWIADHLGGISVRSSRVRTVAGDILLTATTVSRALACYVRRPC